MFANVRNDEIIDFNSLYINEDIVRIETTEEMYNAWLENTNKVMYSNGEITLNPNYEQEEAQKERERLDGLHLTRGDVFRGLLQARGITRAQLRAMIEQMPDTTPEQQIAKEMAFIDFDEALDFYRGVPMINTIGQALEISVQQMDNFFEYNDWHYLINEE